MWRGALLTTAVCGVILSATATDAPGGEEHGQEAPSVSYTYVDATTLGIQGKATYPSSLPVGAYNRLPNAADGVVRDPVWSLSRDCAGFHVDFQSNSPSFSVNITYLYSSTTMWHFPSTGVAGMDLYAFDTVTQQWRWTATTRANNYPVSVNTLQGLINGTTEKYRLHLPLYNGIQSLMIGAEEGKSLMKVAKSTTAPIVWYGTSIAQGGVASRPGQAFTNIIARNLNRDIYNFGFSGNGKMETTVTKFLVQIEDPAPAMLIVDCNWNMDAELIAVNVFPMMESIRESWPTLPVVFAEGTPLGGAWCLEDVREHQDSTNQALRTAYETLKATDDHLYYVESASLYNITGDPQHLINPTVGGTHPSDLGMVAVAKFYTSFLPPILAAHEHSFNEKHEKEQEVHVQAQVRREQQYPVKAAPVSKEQDEQHTEIITSSLLSVAQTKVKKQSMLGSPIESLSLMGNAFNGGSLKPPTPFNRLPAVAQGQIRSAVWELGTMSTGMFVAFMTNSSVISYEFELTDIAEPLWHMPVSGTSGGDLFLFDTNTSSYRFVSTIESFSSTANATVKAEWSVPACTTERSCRFILYLPTRNSLAAGTISVTSNAFLSSDPWYSNGTMIGNNKPVVWYGTSICQSGVVTRPGNSYTNILTRNLNRTVLNFGFAGNGVMEINVAQYLVTIDAALYVIDCLPNMDPDTITERTVPLVQYIRAHRPDTPILLVAGTWKGDHWFDPICDAKVDALTSQYNALIKAGVKNLYLMDNSQDQLFASNPLINPTVGGTHPSDLGHREVADFYTGYLPQFWS